MAAVTFENVSIIFGKQPQTALTLLDQGSTRPEILAKTGQVLGVANASLSVESGEICVLMGLSGSGKSTLLRAVNGLNPVSRGQVLVEYKNQTVDLAICSAQTLRELRMNKIAMVFQQFGLLPWRTVRENVGLGLELRGIGKTERNRIVDEKLELVGLTQWANKYAHELSGGMQQRVGLARAFATDADILLMDEPFSALDPLIRSKLQDELLDLQRQLKKTIIFVSHDLDEAMKLGSQIVIMEDGKIVQKGAAEHIALNPSNAYVAEFVAHMNPLNVLRARSLMTATEKLPQRYGEYELDWSGQNRVRLNADGSVAQVKINNLSVPLQHYEAGMDLQQFRAQTNAPTLISASPDILMRLAIEIRYYTGLPVLLVEDNKLLGVMGGNEIYQGLLELGAQRK